MYTVCIVTLTMTHKPCACSTLDLQLFTPHAKIVLSDYIQEQLDLVAQSTSEAKLLRYCTAAGDCSTNLVRLAAKYVPEALGTTPCTSS